MQTFANENMLPSSRLAKLGLTLPKAAKPSFNYVPVVIEGTLAYVSGQLPKIDGIVAPVGRVGDAIDLEAARSAARTCGLQGLACLAEALGSIDRIIRIVRLTGYIASGPDFFEHPAVVDAASDLMIDVFGKAGQHARSAVGVFCLPRNAPVEIEIIAAIQVAQ